MTLQDLLSDTLLLVFLAILFLYFFSELGRLLWQRSGLKKDIQALMDQVDAESPVEKKAVEDSLRRAWTRYQQSFIEPQAKNGGGSCLTLH